MRNITIGFLQSHSLTNTITVIMIVHLMLPAAIGRFTKVSHLLPAILVRDLLFMIDSSPSGRRLHHVFCGDKPGSPKRDISSSKLGVFYQKASHCRLFG